MGVLVYNLLHILRQFYLVGEEVKRSMEWLIRRLIKVGARVAYHNRSGKSVWLQPCPWPRTTKRCSCEGQEIWLTEERTVRYAEKQENRGLFINVTAVLFLSGLIG